MGFTIIGAFILGLAIGVLVSRAFVVGTLKIDRSDPGKDRYRFDIKDLDALAMKRKIVLKVDPNADLSQK